VVLQSRGRFCQISGVQVYRGCGSLHIFRWHQYQVTLVTEHPRLLTLGPLALQSFYIWKKYAIKSNWVRTTESPENFNGF
jgi:hypothetical protein